MEPSEADTHSFIVRVWREESAAETGAGRATWRGHITHVASGTRRYVQTLEEMAAFVRPYLQQMGVRFSRVDTLRHAKRVLFKRLAGR